MTTETQSGGAALARCIAGSAPAFAADHWGRAPLLSRADELPGDFGDLFSPAAADELVSERGLRTPFLRMARDGVVKAAGGFTRGGGAGAGIADQAADDRIMAQLADGSTLVLQGLHRTWPPLVDFAAHLAEDLGHPVQINAYITPPQNQGFAPHHDTHDVFVLQISGHKHWVAHRPVLENPLDTQPFNGYAAEIAERVAGEAPLVDTVLAPGDALYLPRGTVHSAQALGETSIHLTIGVHPLTRHALVRFLADAVVDDPELRTSLPMGVDLADPEILAPDLAATLAALTRALQRVEVATVAERVGANLRSRTRPEAIGPLAQLELAASLEPETVLRRRAGLRWTLSEPGAETGDGPVIVLSFLDQRLEFPAHVGPALDRALRVERFCVTDLPGLSVEAGLELAARLLREGVLVPA